MKMIKCDRCGRVCKEGNYIMVYKNGNATSDRSIGLDLCPSCENALFQFFKPLPEVVQENK